MREIHAPHETVHTWSAFFIHIATVVIGLLIAVGLEQIVEHFHHRGQADEARESLKEERSINKANFAKAVANWRWEAAELENNLSVLKYIKSHPGTPQAQLPGYVRLNYLVTASVHTAWDAAKQAGVVTYLGKKEAVDYATLYAALDRVEQSDRATWLKLNEALQFQLDGMDPGLMSSVELDQAILAMQATLRNHFLLGNELRVLQTSFPDFPPSVSRDELSKMHHIPNESEALMLGNAYKLTEDRMRAAGYLGAKPSPAAVNGSVEKH
jgi:hypothetical protein